MTGLFDKIIIGAGFYGLYATLFCARRGERILVLEYDDEPFSRATLVNQARVHNGYHYPRSLSTAVKSARYFDRFVEDYGFAVHDSFEMIYGLSMRHSWTQGDSFRRFCERAVIDCSPAVPESWFTPGLCEQAFVVKEYTYDAMILKEYLCAEISRYPSVELRCGERIQAIKRHASTFEVIGKGGDVYVAPFLLNATYASVNQILDLLHEKSFTIKYELCEIIVCDTGDQIRDIGITMMDGPFFSIMPFGKTGLHTLTAVSFTPHDTCYNDLPSFRCQLQSETCSSEQLDNCDQCGLRPVSAWPYMSALARKYLKPELDFSYIESRFSVKPILKTSEIDDSRPTVIMKHSVNPTFVSVLSGKINTVYDLDDVLAT